MAHGVSGVTCGLGRVGACRARVVDMDMDMQMDMQTDMHMGILRRTQSSLEATRWDRAPRISEV